MAAPRFHRARGYASGDGIGRVRPAIDEDYADRQQRRDGEHRIGAKHRSKFGQAHTHAINHILLCSINLIISHLSKVYSAESVFYAKCARKSFRKFCSALAKRWKSHADCAIMKPSEGRERGKIDMHFELQHPADQLVMIMDRIYKYGMTTTSGGNLSVRDDNGDIWITPPASTKALSRATISCR